MKKFQLFIALMLFMALNAQAQNESNGNTSTKFGLKGGFASLALKVDVEGTNVNEDVSGFYLGGFAEFYLSDNFNLLPELTYARFTEDGESSDVLLIPVLLKYKPNERFGLLAGPQFDYLLNEEDSEGLKRLGFGLAVGASYDITDNVIIDARYSFGLSDRIDDLGDFDGFDVKAKLNYFQIGLGYRF
ncbi:PorT family protein [Paucihalobacter ruber]|uniref:PorT family protein n=1 Tax=Paucihalobacter ruber TaxID=2567861 RepID=A0A506PHY8_9FLAO|nr:porin family protein [Paucihalobacter ruber]TPV33431.1 PorT family protein [Paucihalobacter ruber]